MPIPQSLRTSHRHWREDDESVGSTQYSAIALRFRAAEMQKQLGGRVTARHAMHYHEYGVSVTVSRR